MPHVGVCIHVIIWTHSALSNSSNVLKTTTDFTLYIFHLQSYVISLRFIKLLRRVGACRQLSN